MTVRVRVTVRVTARVATRILSSAACYHSDGFAKAPTVAVKK